MVVASRVGGYAASAYPLLVWAEQGYGDNIQFVRYIPLLMELGLDVVLSTRKPLMELFKHCLQPSCPPVVEHKPSELQGFEHHVPLLTLPRILCTNLQTINYPSTAVRITGWPRLGFRR